MLDSSPSTRRLALALLISACLGLALQPHPEDLPGRVWDLRAPHSPDQVTSAQLADSASHECATCHAQIVEEWASTRHAMAWVNEVYQSELKSIVKPAKCHSCHAPQPILLTGVSKRPKTRENDVHLGVDCDSCHRGPGGAAHGPHAVEVAGHESVRDDTFRGLGSNELCLGCHSRSIGPVIGLGRDFDEAELEADGYSCVACHMAPVERSMATLGADGREAPVRKGRSHQLQTPRDPSFLRQAFGISISTQDGVLGVRIANRAGHRIPGLNDRVLDFSVEFQLPGQEAPARFEVRISREEPLRVGEQIWIPLQAWTQGPVHVRGLHTAKSLRQPVEFVNESLALPGNR